MTLPSANPGNEKDTENESLGQYLKRRIGFFGGLIVGLCFFAVCMGIAAGVQNPAWRTAELLICMSSAAVGWFVGILMSPQTTAQSQNFSAYGKGILTFFSGIVVAKIDDIWKFFGPYTDDGRNIGPFIAPALMLVTCFTLGVLITFAAREFGREPVSNGGNGDSIAEKGAPEQPASNDAPDAGAGATIP